MHSSVGVMYKERHILYYTFRKCSVALCTSCSCQDHVNFGGSDGASVTARVQEPHMLLQHTHIAHSYTWSILYNPVLTILFPSAIYKMWFVRTFADEYQRRETSQSDRGAFKTQAAKRHTSSVWGVTLIRLTVSLLWNKRRTHCWLQDEVRRRCFLDVRSLSFCWSIYNSLQLMSISFWHEALICICVDYVQVRRIPVY